MGRLDGRVAIITGGASGIGAASVRRFAAEGAKVLVADIDEARGAALAKDLGAVADFARCDHTDTAQCEATVRRTLDRFGKLDILFNNAGTPTGGPIGKVTDAELERVIAINLHGPFRMTRAAMPALKDAAKSLKGGASIVFTSSLQGIAARPNLTPYTAAKHGVVGLMRCLALEVGGDNVRVNAICPVATETPMFRQFMPPRVTDEQMAQVRTRVTEQIPLKRMATADDIANAALFLASDEASMITGVALPVDGGMTAG
jgi:NAD(P)-dependent dehydrogenase (short-subunit alcohol dehydrogenase family)